MYVLGAPGQIVRYIRVYTHEQHYPQRYTKSTLHADALYDHLVGAQMLQENTL